MPGPPAGPRESERMMFGQGEMFRDQPFQRKAMWCLALFVAMQIFSVTAFFFVQAGVKHANALTTQTYQVIDGISKLTAAKRSQFGALSSYRLSPSDTVLGLYTQSRGEI